MIEIKQLIKKQKRIAYNLEKAIKMNKVIEKVSKSYYEVDISKMRIKILKQKYKTVWRNINELQQQCIN